MNTADMTGLYPTSGHPIMPKTHRVTETAERRSIGRTTDSTPLLNRFIHRNWEMFLMWGFAVVSFAALFFCFWAISAKCHGNWPL